MSYILDALNKAEQARQQQQVEQPMPQPIETIHNNKTPSKLLLITLIVCVAFILVYALLPRQETNQRVAIVSTAAPEKQHQQTPSISPPSALKPPAKAIQPLTNEPIDTNPRLASDTKITVLPTLMTLPQHILDNLPAITISAHTYNTIAAKRMVIINNKVLHENRPVSEHLFLKNITPHGVELEYDSTTFSMTAFDTWPY